MLSEHSSNEITRQAKGQRLCSVLPSGLIDNEHCPLQDPPCVANNALLSHERGGETTSDNRKDDGRAVAGAEYKGRLARQPLSANTKRAYRTRVSQYLEYLAATAMEYGDPLEYLHARDDAVRDYKGHLNAVKRTKPSS